MEDITTTSASFSKDELAAVARHPVCQSVQQIMRLRAAATKIARDDSRSPRVVKEMVSDKIDIATRIWQRLGPSRAMARRLFPDQGDFFDLLDKALAVRHAIIDISAHRALKNYELCDLLCCRNVL